ncbi:MAG TPA: glycine/sarcosine/betaine reductase selenoprotein B family protein [Chloroflexota bacterium]
MPFSYVEFITEELAKRGQQYHATETPNFPPPRLTPLRKPIAESTIGVFTSAGVHLKTEPPLGETNDLSYRLIDRDVPLSELKFAHMTAVRPWAEQDLNVAYPRDRLIELEAEGTIGRLAPKAVSMVGSITRYTELLTEVVPRIESEFERQEVDLAFLFPL